MAITFKGSPVSLAGHFIKAGSKAPDFSLVQTDLMEYSLKNGQGNFLVLNIFPSLDTNICATTVRKFNKMATRFPGVKVLCISKDLPFAHNRFCVTEGIENVVSLSDFRYDSEFGHKYGVLIIDGPLKGLLTRAVVIITPEGNVIYSQIVPEITHEPDYDMVIKWLSSYLVWVSVKLSNAKEEKPLICIFRSIPVHFPRHLQASLEA